ncbi:MAG: helix-turn-helix domain-containing protein [Flavobacteriia bacterium]|nr:helix-turn-helix domain-containing protein [Flavobacteriia bacterium]
MEIKKTDFIQSLEKGLNVISAFDETNQQMTLTEVSKIVGLTRANARRVLLTLRHLGYVDTLDERYFFLTAKVLSLGYSYLSGLPFRELALPFMQDLAKEINESCSMSVLDKNEIVYVARVHTQRIMNISLAVGTRLPAHATSMGKVIISGLNEPDRKRVLQTIDFQPYTENTLSRKAFIKQLEVIKNQQWAISNEELEIGVRSIACPVRDKKGNIVAAINISGHASRVTVEDLEQTYLPVLREKVGHIESALKLL